MPKPSQHPSNLKVTLSTGVSIAISSIESYELRNSILHIFTLRKEYVEIEGEKTKAKLDSCFREIYENPTYGKRGARGEPIPMDLSDIVKPWDF